MFRRGVLIWRSNVKVSSRYPGKPWESLELHKVLKARTLDRNHSTPRSATFIKREDFKGGRDQQSVRPYILQ